MSQLPVVNRFPGKCLLGEMSLREFDPLWTNDLTVFTLNASMPSLRGKSRFFPRDPFLNWSFTVERKCKSCFPRLTEDSFRLEVTFPGLGTLKKNQKTFWSWVVDSNLVFHSQKSVSPSTRVGHLTLWGSTIFGDLFVSYLWLFSAFVIAESSLDLL